MVRTDATPRAPLPPEFFRRDSRVVAPELLGHVIETRFGGEVTAGRIVEVEAYRQEDPASHCHGGMTPRNSAMFLEGGHLYVYFIYGMHYCANVVAGEEGYGEGILLRGIEPVEGIEVMRRRRGPHVRDRDLANGPAKLAQALGIGPAENGVDATDPESPVTFLVGSPPPPAHIIATPRIGITKAAELPWRWVVK